MLSGNLCDTWDRKKRQIQIGNLCFHVGFRKTDWYTARWKCKKEKGDLAYWNASNNSILSQMRKEISNKKNIVVTAKHAEFWIGLRGSRFVCDTLANGETQKQEIGKNH